MEEYLVKFEELRSLLSLAHPSLDETYFVSSFISELDEQIRPTVKMLYLTSVGQAAEQAYLYEMALDAFVKGHQLSLKGSREENLFGTASKVSNPPWQRNVAGRSQATPIQTKDLTLD